MRGRAHRGQHRHELLHRLERRGQLEVHLLDSQTNQTKRANRWFRKPSEIQAPFLDLKMHRRVLLRVYGDTPCFARDGSGCGEHCVPCSAHRGGSLGRQVQEI